MNNVSLSGNMTRDIEMRVTQAGKKVGNLSIAINEGKDKTEYVNLVAWDKTAELIEQYCRKGDRFACTGRLQTSTWDKDGEKRYKTEVVINTFDFPPKSNSQQKPDMSAHGAPVDDLEQSIPF